MNMATQVILAEAVAQNQCLITGFRFLTVILEFLLFPLHMTQSLVFYHLSAGQPYKA